MDIKTIATLSAVPVWVKDDPDGVRCGNCKEVLLSSKNVLAIETIVAGKKNIAKTKFALCNACLEIFENEDP